MSAVRKTLLRDESGCGDGRREFSGALATGLAELDRLAARDLRAAEALLAELSL